ncbi:hypothetical protein B0H19DRAFT_1271804 [Mycena capillaripes]|nr:hypothetical protein B0H19DRAFT_1271804 [Mycena capillaripes]
MESSGSEAEDSELEMSPTPKQGKQRGRVHRKKEKEKRSDSWIWLESMTREQKRDDTKLAEYKTESDHVQRFRMEAEMYHWLEQYKCKHTKLMHIIDRYQCDSEVWVGLVDQEEWQSGGVNSMVTFTCMQAAMYT